MHAVIHTNPSIHWQVKYSKALISGLESQGITARISHKQTDKADLTIVLGPHWCAEHHSDCLYLDRAFWGDPEAVSIHWVVNHQKVYDWTPREGRTYPEPKPMKSGDRTLVLCDYRKDYQVNGTKRKHPTESRSNEPLNVALSAHDQAYGGRSTALVDAAINGLKVTTLEKNTPVDPISGQDNPDRERWLKALSWHNWTFEEIKKGDLWPHFLKSKP